MSQAAKIKTLISEDWEWVRLSKKNPKHFKELYVRYYKSIFLFILKRTNDKSVAADLSSEVFLTALSKIDQFQYRGFPFSSWLYKIAVNKCTDYFKDQSKRRYVIIDDRVRDHFIDEVVDKEVKSDIIKSKVIAALNELQPTELEMIELRYFEKNSFREIAYFKNITENNAKVRVYRIITKLRAIITNISDEK